MVAFPTFVGSWPWPWPRIGSHCIPSCIARRPLPTHQISFKSKKLFVDGRTDVRTDGHLRPTNVIRSTRRSRPKNSTYSIHLPLISASLRLLILRILSSAWKQDIFHTDTATITHNICPNNVRSKTVTPTSETEDFLISFFLYCGQRSSLLLDFSAETM